MNNDAQRLTHYIALLEDELHQSQRRQQALIAALDRARAELQALDGGALFHDGEVLHRGRWLDLSKEKGKRLLAVTNWLPGTSWLTC